MIENLSTFIKRLTSLSLLISAILIVLAVFMILNPDGVMSPLIRIIGIVIIGGSLYHAYLFLNLSKSQKAFSHLLVLAIAEFSFGVVALFNPNFIISIVYWIIGTWIIFDGIIKMQASFILRDELSNWALDMVISILTIVSGLFIILHPILSSNSVVFTIGICLLISQIMVLFDTVSLIIKLNKIKTNLVKEFGE
jgi:uncharacterized membrane protein HdeD (DUF308 family)